MSMVKIEARSKHEAGHRRCGRFWGAEPTVADVTEAEALVLEACTALLTRRIVVNDEAKVVIDTSATSKPDAKVASVGGR